MADDADRFPDLLPEPVAATLAGLVPGPEGSVDRPERAPLVAVTGVTGYVGGRLVPAVRRRRDRRGRRRRADADPRGARRGGHRVLPHPLARYGPRVRGARPANRARVIPHRA